MINDWYGHNFGDEVLIEVAERIKKGLRASDTVARLSGDEFAVLLLDSAASSEAARVAKRIQDTLRSPILWQGHEVFVSASIGIALSDLSYQLVEEIVRDADIAMYQAKSRGKAQHVVFDKPMRARVLARLDMEAELRQAIGQGEFQVYYQPIMSLDEERLVGFEAFVRWQHPTRGLLNAADFIPIAEETGLIIPIDWWVLRAACQQLVTWQRQFPFTPPLTVSVNLSKRHFAEQDLVDQLKNILQATGLDSTCLRLEITERVMTENPITATSLLVQVQALGVQLLIDNFGIGPTSINWLQQFPVNAVKIDPSFIRELDNAGNPVDFVHNLVAQARDMGLEVIAERIENLDQLAQLQDLACKFGQGYLFAKPMDHQTATAFVS
jgi:diguanylate cyclase (GGDEF)-like protein